MVTMFSSPPTTQSYVVKIIHNLSIRFYRCVPGSYVLLLLLSYDGDYDYDDNYYEISTGLRQSLYKIV